LEATSPLLTLPETTPAGVAVRDAATSLVRTLLGEPSQPPSPVTLPRNWPNRPGASVARAAQVLDELAGTGQGWQDLAHGPDVPPGVGDYLAAFAPAGAALAGLLRATAAQEFTEGQSAGQHLASTHTAELILASHRAAA
jgi:hypothetical protein